MAEKLGHVACTPVEDLWISLTEMRGEKYLEFRPYAHPRQGEAAPLPGGSAVRIPVGVLSSLLRVLHDAQDRLVQRGTIYIPPVAVVTVMEQGVAKTLPLPGRPRTSETRRHPRAPLSVPVECRVIEPDSFWPAKPVSGETKDVSVSGAQVWLPKRLPRFKQVDVVMVVDGMVFRGRAEVAGVDLEANKDPATGYFRHSLRWIMMEGPAKSVLEKVIATDKERRNEPKPDSGS
jgi:hypothetical protein